MINIEHLNGEKLNDDNTSKNISGPNPNYVLFQCGVITATVFTGESSVLTAILFDIPALIFLWFVLYKVKKGSPLLGLSTSVWVITSLIGYALGVLLIFAE